MGARLIRVPALSAALLVGTIRPGCGREPPPVDRAVSDNQSEAAAGAADSTSLIVRSTHILDVAIANAAPGPWRKDTERTRKRRVDLDLVLERALKGTVRERSGSHVRLAVEQIAPAGQRYFAVPGVWSGRELTQGARFLLFSRSPSTSAQEVLAERSTERVLPEGEAIGDVELALSAEQEGTSLTAVLERARARGSSLGPLFAEYLNARLGDLLFSDSSGFGALVAFVEDPALPLPFRGMVIREMFSRLLLVGPAPAAFVDRLALAGFRVLAQPEAQALHAELVGVLLPNLVGVRGGAPKRSAAEVFRGAAQERAAAERALAALPDSRAAEPMLAWIRG